MGCFWAGPNADEGLTGRAAFESSRCTKSVKSYAVQLGFGPEYALEIWREIEDYGTYDRLDDDMLANPEK